MKTSNQLLIGLIVIVFAAIVGTATVLKGEYEKIDKDDPYYGYTSEVLGNFNAIRIEGKYPGLIQIQQADKYEVKRNGPTAAEFQWDIRNDTLVLTHPETEIPERFSVKYILSRRSNFYVTAPSLTSVRSAFAICKLNSWELPILELAQRGQGRAMALTESTISNLTATVSDSAIMQIEQTNQIKQATIEVRDVSTFIMRPTAIDSLSIDVDEEAQVTIPGSLLQQVNITDN